MFKGLLCEAPHLIFQIWLLHQKQKNPPDWVNCQNKVVAFGDDMLLCRVRSGMENARAKGRQIGRPQVRKEDIPAAFLRHYPAHKNGQLNISELARVCDISRTTAYKYIGLWES